MLKYDADASPSGPSNPTALLGPAEQQLKSIGKLGLTEQLETCPARGIIHNLAIYNWILRTDDQFGRVGNTACRPHTREPSRIHRSLPQSESASRVAEYSKGLVDPRKRSKRTSRLCTAADANRLRSSFVLDDVSSIIFFLIESLFQRVLESRRTRAVSS